MVIPPRFREDSDALNRRIATIVGATLLRETSSTILSCQDVFPNGLAGCLARYASQLFAGAPDNESMRLAVANELSHLAARIRWARSSNLDSFPASLRGAASSRASGLLAIAAVDHLSADPLDPTGAMRAINIIGNYYGERIRIEAELMSGASQRKPSELLEPVIGAALSSGSAVAGGAGIPRTVADQFAKLLAEVLTLPAGAAGHEATEGVLTTQIRSVCEALAGGPDRSKAEVTELWADFFSWRIPTPYF